DEATAAITTAAGQHDDAGRCEHPDTQLGQVAASVLHHLEQADVKVIDHEAVDVAHLRLRYRRQLVKRKGLHFAPWTACDRTAIGLARPQASFRLRARGRCLPFGARRAVELREPNDPGAGECPLIAWPSSESMEFSPDLDGAHNR